MEKSEPDLQIANDSEILNDSSLAAEELSSVRTGPREQSDELRRGNDRRSAVRESGGYQEPSTAPRSFRSTREAVQTFTECSAALTEYLESIHSSREDLLREAEGLRDRERRLTDELTRFRGIDEEFEKQKLAVLEAERRRQIHEESLRAAQDEANAKAESLNRLRAEYKELLERSNLRTEELEQARASLADSDRKRVYFEQASEEQQSELKLLKKDLAESHLKLLEQTSSINEREAKLAELESALDRNAQELAAHSVELKEVKWELLQHREELRVAKSELARKSTLLTEREQELEAKIEQLRQHEDDAADAKREHQRALREVADHEDSLRRANEKIAELSATMVRFDKELATAQDEADQRRRALRQSEEKRKLDEAERISLEQDLSVTRDSLKRKAAALDEREKQLEALNRKLDAENSRRREAEEQRQQVRNELQSVREQIAELREALASAEERYRLSEEEKHNARKDLEALQHEHRSLLRVETRQADELEQLAQELTKKSEALREASNQAAALREQAELATMKMEQQAMALVTLQQKSARDQEELQTFKRQLQKASRLPQLDAEIESLRQELRARDLRMEQQEQLIRMLQSRLGDRRVVPLAPREAAAAAANSSGAQSSTTEDARHLLVASKAKPQSNSA